MGNSTSPAAGRGKSLFAGLFGRKPAAPAPRPPEPDTRAADFQTWPWAPIHDLRAEPFGPLTPHATTRDSGDWQLTLGENGLRVTGNTHPDIAITIGGAIDERLSAVRLTAEMDVRALNGDGSLAALVIAAQANDRLIMGLLSDGEVIVFRMRGMETELIGQCVPAAHPSGMPGRIALQAMVIQENAILYANGQYLGTVTDPVLVGQSAGAGFQVKGNADVTLCSFTVDGLRVGGHP